MDQIESLLMAIVMLLLGVFCFMLQKKPDETFRALGKIWSNSFFFLAPSVLLFGVLCSFPNLPTFIISKYIFSILSILLCVYFLRFPFIVVFKEMDRAGMVKSGIIFFIVFNTLVISYGTIFYFVNDLSHGAAFSISPLKHEPTDYLNFVYFSYVTITTLGYGDITPILWYAKLLCIFELISGLFLVLFYVTALIKAQQTER